MRSARHKRLISYIPQQEVLSPKQTVKEVIRYYADLQLDPADWSSKEKEVLVAQTIELMGLTERANTYIGGVLPGGKKKILKIWVQRWQVAIDFLKKTIGLRVPGISGGQKKRVAVKKFLH